jgi:CO/xanthine dehydrogenase FAD-binding subunit
MLAAASREIGAVQIQHRGTLGGSIANESPAGDTLPVLAAAEAPTVVRARRTEDALAAGASITEAQRILQTEISPIDDMRSTAAYRREVAARLLAQSWTAGRT